MFSFTTNIAKSYSPFLDNCHIEKLSWVAINLPKQKSRKVGEKFGEWEKSCKFAMQIATGVLAHLVERNTGSVEVSGSSPLCSTK